MPTQLSNNLYFTQGMVRWVSSSVIWPKELLNPEQCFRNCFGV